MAALADEVTYIGMAFNVIAIICGFIIVLSGDYSLTMMTIVAAAWPALGMATWIRVTLTDDSVVLSVILPSVVMFLFFFALIYLFYKAPFIAPALLLGAVVFVGTAVGCCASLSAMDSYWTLLPAGIALLFGGIFGKYKSYAKPATVNRNLPRGVEVDDERSCIPSFLDVIASLVGSCFVVTGIMYVLRGDRQSLVDIVQNRLATRTDEDCPERDASVVGLAMWSGLAVLFIFCVRRKLWRGVLRKTIYRASPDLLSSAEVRVVEGYPISAKKTTSIFGRRNG
jgi:hypothetical protein